MAVSDVTGKSQALNESVIQDRQKQYQITVRCQWMTSGSLWQHSFSIRI